jgi:hypothetical protein
MRRFWILLIVAAMAMALAAPATGKKGKPNPGEVLPQAGFSCVEYENIAPKAAGRLLIWENLQYGDSLSLEGEHALTSGKSVCVDIWNSEPGSFNVEVKEADGAKRNSILFALIKDSHAGDHCGQAVGAPGSALNIGLNDEFDEGELAGDITGVPAATINACGIEYSEADVQNVDGQWVVVNPTIVQDGTRDPLVLGLGITGKPGVTADVTITYCAPNAPNAPKCPPAVVTGIDE